MKPLKLKEEQNGVIFEYHFYPRDEEMIISSSEKFYNNKVLWKECCETEGMSESYRKYNISNHSVGENFLLYMLLIWQLKSNRSLQGVAIWETDFVEHELKQEPKLINWEYEIKHEIVESDLVEIENTGFQRARSPQLSHRDEKLIEIPVDKTGLFDINTFQELSDFLKSSFIDASNTSNFYLSEDSARILLALKSEKKPSLDTLLGANDIFICLVIGEDIGYYDYLFIASPSNLSSRLDQIVDNINSFATNYITGIKTVQNSKEMIDMIDSLIQKYNFI